MTWFFFYRQLDFNYERKTLSTKSHETARKKHKAFRVFFFVLFRVISWIISSPRTDLARPDLAHG
jgi:hypothetical protein